LTGLAADDHAGDLMKLTAISRLRKIVAFIGIFRAALIGSTAFTGL